MQNERTPRVVGDSISAPQKSTTQLQCSRSRVGRKLQPLVRYLRPMEMGVPRESGTVATRRFGAGLSVDKSKRSHAALASISRGELALVRFPCTQAPTRLGRIGRPNRAKATGVGARLKPRSTAYNKISSFVNNSGHPLVN